MEGKSVLRCKWALQIVLKLTEGQKRPSQLLREIEGLKERVLFDRLSRLMKGGLIGKWTVEGYPKESYYYLKNSEEFLPLREWLSSVDLPVEDMVRLFSCKWTLPIMELLEEPKSPSQIREMLDGISDKVLQERLKRLEDLNLVHREVLPTRPPKVLYSLSTEGKDVLPTLKRLENFTLCKPRRRSPSPSPERGS